MEARSVLRVLVGAVLIVLLMGMDGCKPGEPGEVLSIAIDGGDVTLAIGDSHTLTVSVATTGNVSRGVRWSSSLDDVASVTTTGLVTAVEEGVAQITATSLADTSKSDSVTVIVTATQPDPDDGDTVSAEDVRAFAVELYDTVEAEASPADLIRGLVDAFGWYIDEDAVLSDVEEAMAGRIPVILEDHVLGMARGYESGMYVTAESFVESMVEFGAYSKVTSQPLSLSDLSDGLAHLVTQEAYETDEVVAALIVHLGLERGTRSEALDDAVWGDGLLDPLQFTLLAYAVLLSSDEDVVDQLKTGNPPALTSGLGKKLVDLTFEFLGVPTLDAPAAVVCASALMSGHVMQLEVDEHLINRRWPENPAGSSPHQSELRATLAFDFVPKNQVSRVIIETACGDSLPPVGPVSGSTVEWRLHDELPQHGSLDVHDAETGLSGAASATYVAFDERVPRLLRRGLRSAASGSVEVWARNVLPFKWRSLQLVPRLIGKGPVAATRITVNYYELPELEAVIEASISSVCPGVGPVTTGELAASVRLEVDEAGAAYRGTTIWRNRAASLWMANMVIRLDSLQDGGPFDVVMPVAASEHELRFGMGLPQTLPSETYTDITDPRYPETWTQEFTYVAFAAIHVETGHCDFDGNLPAVASGPWQLGPKDELTSLVASTRYTLEYHDKCVNRTDVQVELFSLE